MLRDVELPTVKIDKTQMDKESSEQPGFDINPTLNRGLDLKPYRGSFQPKELHDPMSLRKVMSEAPQTACDKKMPLTKTPYFLCQLTVGKWWPSSYSFQL